MFVKIINHGADQGRHELLYDCKRVSIRETKKAEGIAEVILDVGEQNERSLLLATDCHEIIYMNNNGKTIDRKVW